MIASVTGPGERSGPDRWVNGGAASELLGRWRGRRGKDEQQEGRRGKVEREGRPR